MNAGSLTPEPEPFLTPLHSTNSQSKMDALSTVKLVPKVEYTLIPLLFTQPELGEKSQQSLPSPPPRMH